MSAGAVPTRVPELVTLHLWGIPASAVPLALSRMAVDRWHLRSQPPRFSKLLGTGRGRTFTWRDADPQHWGLLATWDSSDHADEFEHSATLCGWRRIATEELSVRMRPISSRGRWSRQRPFGEPVPTPHDGPVASITRARIRPRRMRAFQRAIPPPSTDLHRVAGLRLAIGIGESPVGLQGTFSIWHDATALTEYAHRRPAHRDVIRQTTQQDWYSEELFARFAVLSIDGTHSGRKP